MAKDSKFEAKEEYNPMVSFSHLNLPFDRPFHSRIRTIGSDDGFDAFHDIKKSKVLQLKSGRRQKGDQPFVEQQKLMNEKVFKKTMTTNFPNSKISRDFFRKRNQKPQAKRPRNLRTNKNSLEKGSIALNSQNEGQLPLPFSLESQQY